MKKANILIGLIIATLSCTAQVKLPELCQVGMPRILDSELIKESEIKQFLASPDWGQSQKVDKYWVVYSDRENNITYNKPDKSSGRFSSLNFNEELRIAKLQNGFALVYKEEKSGSIYPKINSGKTRGWVPMSDLLLWQSCPTNNLGIYRKALPHINVDEYIKHKDSNIGKTFKNPVTKSEQASLMTGVDFYFVMKEDPESGLVLLSRLCNLVGNTSQVLYGWVSKASFVPWNQRLCLEPNWNREVAEKFAALPENKRNIPVYRDSNLTNLAGSISIGSDNSLGKRATMYRMYPDEMRYVLFDNDKKKDGIYKILAFTRLDSKEYGARARKAKNDTKTKILLKDVFGEDELKKMREDNMRCISFIGYTREMSPELGESYWRPVICISEDEFKDLMTNLQGVMAAVCSGSDVRRPYVTAMKTLVRTMIPDITEAQMQQKGNKEIMAMVAGLNVSSDALRGRTLEEILDSRIVSDEEFQGLVTNFVDKFNKLDQMRTSEYPFSIMRNGTRWFWIPVADLP